ncbi:glycosyltransferase family 2 protein [Spirosoma taeanense]|uniref:Glycosyltransferase family 2 protein n=1 Tax=Spirosoma taeanense TaxID=2735870 RepID=A0A6M5YA29_9BACT|nr:glycosyltransferase [Spirosoma taeanense]QJW90063.1 glycosyltransferase family 2 protein [Spirosoma taeanense]
METALHASTARKSRLPLHPCLFAQPLPAPQLLLTVVVPVRNEAHHLTQTLDALRRQQDPHGQPLPPAHYEVLLLANNCTDRSYAIARQYQRQFPDFPLHVAQIALPDHQANVGTVRRLLMDEAYRRLMSLDKPQGIIASTDGDTIVDPQWVYQTLQEIANGNDAVGGRILTRPDGSPVRINHLRNVTYRTLIARAESILDPCPHDPWPRHFQHFGASLAVTCAMYRRAGRLPMVPHLEDEAFYRALLRADAKVRKSPHVRVFTSTRLQGRVAVGFSEQLRYWNGLNRTGQYQVVEPSEAVLIRLRNRHRLRICWQAGGQVPTHELLGSIATALGIPETWLRKEFRKYGCFGELWERVEQQMAVGRWSARWQPVPITTAIAGLRRFLRLQARLNDVAD